MSVEQLKEGLRGRVEKQRRAQAVKIRTYAEAQLKNNMLPESRSRFLAEIESVLSSLFEENDPCANLGALALAEELIHLAIRDANFPIPSIALIVVSQLPTSNEAILHRVCHCVALLSKVDTVTQTEFFDSQTKRALEWLKIDMSNKDDVSRQKRYCAVVLLSTIAAKIPGTFTAHAPDFINLIWGSVYDTRKLSSYSHSQSAVAVACLQKSIATATELQKTAQTWAVFGQCRKALRSDSITPEVITNFLTILGSLLDNAGSLIESPFADIADLVLQHRQHKSASVRTGVCSLFAKIARLNPAAFTDQYLDTIANHLLTVLRGNEVKERPSALAALAAIAEVTGPTAMEPFMGGIIQAIKDVLVTRSKDKDKERRNLTATIDAVAKLAGVTPDTMKPHIDEILDLLFSRGLCDTLIGALKVVAQHIPSIQGSVRAKLLNHVSFVLTGYQFAHLPASKRALTKTRTIPAYIHDGSSITDPATVELAIRTLANFDLGPEPLTDFVADCVVNYLDHSIANIRLAAAVTAARVLVPPGRTAAAHGKDAVVVGDVLYKLLVTAFSDEVVGVRRAVLAEMDSRYDRFLAEAEALQSLFCLANDEDIQVREASLTIIGRLAEFNPAYVVPATRNHVIELLNALDLSHEPRQREDTARLLGHLTVACPTLVRPYVVPIMHGLLAKIHDPSPPTATAALVALGNLAKVGARDLQPFIPELVPHVLDLLTDQSSTTKRVSAFRTLGQLAQSTGYAIEAYKKHPQLMPTILAAIREENSVSIRAEVTKVLGIFGALDPFALKVIDASDTLDTKGGPPTIFPTEHGETGLDATAQSPITEVYYSSVALKALLRVARDPSLRHCHPHAFRSVAYIQSLLGSKCVAFLGDVVPAIVAAVRDPQATTFQRKTNCFQLAMIVTLAQTAIQPYSDAIVEVVQEYWSDCGDVQVALIVLLQVLSIELGDAFMPYLPKVLPKFIRLFERCCHNPDDVPKEAALQCLAALEGLGPTLDPFSAQFITQITRLFDVSSDAEPSHDLAAAIPAEIRLAALETLSRLTKSVNFTAHVCRVIPPLRRAIQYGEASTVDTAVNALCAVVYQLDRQFYAFYIPQMHKVMAARKVKHAVYQSLVNQILDPQGKSLDPSTLDPIHTDAHTFGPPKIEWVRRMALSMSHEETHMYSFGTADAASTFDPDASATVDESVLKSAWDTSQASTRDDWISWMRRLTHIFIQSSPSPSIRSCASVPHISGTISPDLMNAAFVSVWTALRDGAEAEFASQLTKVLQSQSLPIEVLQILLRLAEYLEHLDHSLPIDYRVLGHLASNSHAFAKALRYQEQEFVKAPSACVEDLISTNSQLQLPEAATGILIYSQQRFSGNIRMQESWFEKLERWDEALDRYNARLDADPYHGDAMWGKLRCMSALGAWSDIHSIADELWDKNDRSFHSKVSPFGARAALHLKDWKALARYAPEIPKDEVDAWLFSAIDAVHSNRFAEARAAIGAGRTLVDSKLAALVSESYDRGYSTIVLAQQLVELEEVIRYKLEPDVRPEIEALWQTRLQGMQQKPEVWLDTLAIRSLVIEPRQDYRSYVKLAALCRSAGRAELSLQTVMSLFQTPSEVETLRAAVHVDRFDQTALEFITASLPQPDAVNYSIAYALAKHYFGVGEVGPAMRLLVSMCDGNVAAVDPGLAAHVVCRIGMNLPASPDKEFIAQRLVGDDETHGSPVLVAQQKCYHDATKYDPAWQTAWSLWSESCNQFVQQLDTNRMGAEAPEPLDPVVQTHLIHALRGFFKTIALGQGQSLPPTLRILTLWFSYGQHSHVEEVLLKGFASVPLETWLGVIPQIIARLHTASVPVRNLVHQLLGTLGHRHPQALVYPLAVASKGHSSNRQADALSILDRMRRHSATLVDQALMVSRELIRVAILWPELWRAGLEEASRQYFNEKNTEACLETLARLHSTLERGAQTMSEVSFISGHGGQLLSAFELCKKFSMPGEGDVSLITTAWDTYFAVFRAIAKHLNTITSLELKRVSPNLLAATNLELAVPGGYHADRDPIRIVSFKPQLQVIMSKQRPRKLSMVGSDGNTFLYLLKGHEDTRQDERMMQFFGLVNQLLAADRATCRNDLYIQRYAVIPLSPNSGLLGWLPHGDTLHHLLREYRERHNIFTNLELRQMYHVAPAYDHLALLQKVEAFEYALDNTDGRDLAKAMWAKAPSSEQWLAHRTRYTRSLAVMSMVGYLLGLGDRHPSNLMLDRKTGKIIHIDFGDSFEVAVHRLKYPEKIPFRLTRMLVLAMEASGVEGSFRLTCEATMRVLRSNRTPLMALLEAFVYDPLLSWNLVNICQANNYQVISADESASMFGKAPNKQNDIPELPPPHIQAQGIAESVEKEEANAVDREGRKRLNIVMHEPDSKPRSAAPGIENDDIPAELNEKAVAVIRRVQDKLTGFDFRNVAGDKALDIGEQVQRLIRIATNHENLCQAYVGWCACQ
ncbi:Serine/Threonine-protein kinase TOR [Carpediemonas membranifera]|uniref:Serine/threonine-protein kinase TOR n=1 Tax=Carpediemonas membranifera TaxID=201153 RepID=A0A8J6BY53_9EUKA|nr:Serine/Threonine-protein kinase TOR [Carpediemonas membranifera]|eukprot:KAG9394146.1 Serine/Threonine-protein kinase TOR [Carpediemonas membranifera]